MRWDLCCISLFVFAVELATGSDAGTAQAKLTDPPLTANVSGGCAYKDQMCMLILGTKACCDWPDYACGGKPSEPFGQFAHCIKTGALPSAGSTSAATSEPVTSSHVGTAQVKLTDPPLTANVSGGCAYKDQMCMLILGTKACCDWPHYVCGGKPSEPFGQFAHCIKNGAQPSAGSTSAGTSEPVTSSHVGTAQVKLTDPPLTANVSGGCAYKDQMCMLILGTKACCDWPDYACGGRPSEPFGQFGHCIKTGSHESAGSAFAATSTAEVLV